MKTLFFTLLFALSTFISFSQNNYTLNGNLGVGTSPTHKLSVAGDSKMTGELTVTEKSKLEGGLDVSGDLKLVNISTEGTNIERLLYLDENGNIQKMTTDMIDDMVNLMYNRDCTITSWKPTWSNGVDKLYVTPGNCPVDLMVGIGTATPTARFEISGIENGHQFKINSSNTMKALAVNTSGIENFTLLGSGQVSIAHQSNTQSAFTIKDEANQDVYRIMGNGHVWATEVSVRLKEDFPDYVFEEEYVLMPLEELKTYIQENKKLPNMPSAEKVATQGLDLGETDRLLTEKVEELTLYILLLKEEIDALKAQNVATQNTAK